jgi:hypothetical protein
LDIAEGGAPEIHENHIRTHPFDGERRFIDEMDRRGLAHDGERDERENDGVEKVLHVEN